MPQVKLIVGLGNPGKQYEATRHNAGFWFIDELLRRYSGNLQRKEKFFGFVGSTSISDHSVHLLKPDTFMNLSGKSVQALATFYQISVTEILIVHDELDIAYGEVRLKTSGGHGGHNGLRDINRCFGQQDYQRLRIGIGHPGHASQVTAHVLNRPSVDEKILIDRAIVKSVDQISNIINGEMETAMQALHKKGGH